jgi:hypothetical protein
MVITVFPAFPQQTVWYARKNGKSWPIFTAPSVVHRSETASEQSLALAQSQAWGPLPVIFNPMYHQNGLGL